MGSSRKRSLDRSNHKQVDLLETEESAKKRKTASATAPGGAKKSSLKNQPIPDYEPPKSKKELRALKKAARKQKQTEEKHEVDSDGEEKILSKEEYKQQKQNEKKEQRKAMMQELRKQERENKKIRQQRRLNREKNAPKRKQLQTEETKEVKQQQQSSSEKKNKKKPKKQSSQQEEQDVAMKALKQVLRGSTDESGMTTTTLGVKYKDIVVGTGDEALEKKMVTVRYQLKGGKFMAVLDSSKKFNFRVGKGEVIQGWDIGLVGMRVGGRRQLIVPPKAGYGSQDIGAGPGGLLYFDITLLAIR